MLKRLDFAENNFDFLQLIKAWPKLVGPILGQNSYPLKIKNDTLFILTKHGVFSHELSFQGEALKQKIFSDFPHLQNIIKNITFQASESFFQSPLFNKSVQDPAPLHPHNPVVKKAKLEAQEIFSDVENTEMKEALISIFIQQKLNNN